MEWYNQINERNDAIKEHLLQEQTRQFKPYQRNSNIEHQWPTQEENFYIEQEEEAPQEVQEEVPNYYYDPETGEYFEYEGDGEEDQEFVDDNGALIEAEDDEDEDIINELEEEQGGSEFGHTAEWDQGQELSSIQKKYLEKYGIDPEKRNHYSFNVNLANRSAI